MARFRDMQKFVRFVKDEHQVRSEKDATSKDVAVSGSDVEWPPAGKTRDKFAKKTKLTQREVSDICDDCLAFNYLKYSQLRFFYDGNDNDSDNSLIVTSKGRHLLLKLGLVREVFKDNSDWLNVATAFIVGILAASTPFIIYLLSKHS